MKGWPWRRRRCSFCRRPGHSWQNCPDAIVASLEDRDHEIRKDAEQDARKARKRKRKDERP